jgi:hypothetical protein
LSTLQVEKATVFSTSVLFDDNAEIQFSPNGKQVEDEVLEVMHDMVSLLNTLPRVLYHPSLEKYVAQSGQRPETVLDGTCEHMCVHKNAKVESRLALQVLV